MRVSAENFTVETVHTCSASRIGLVDLVGSHYRIKLGHTLAEITLVDFFAEYRFIKRLKLREREQLGEQVECQRLRLQLAAQLCERLLNHQRMVESQLRQAAQRNPAGAAVGNGIAVGLGHVYQRRISY